MFIGYWKSSSEAYGLGEPIQIETPTVIQPVWEQNTSQPNTSPPDYFWLLASILLFSLLLTLNLKLNRKKRLPSGSKVDVSLGSR